MSIRRTANISAGPPKKAATTAMPGMRDPSPEGSPGAVRITVDK
jgi:hypothetical protein